MMSNVNAWRELYRSSDPDRIRKLLTSIAAMEFDVRSRNAEGESIAGDTEQFGPGPYVIEVSEADWSALQDVVEEIIAEQDEFDALLDSREHRLSLVRRRVLIVLIIIVAILGILGLIDL